MSSDEHAGGAPDQRTAEGQTPEPQAPQQKGQKAQNKDSADSSKPTRKGSVVVTVVVAVLIAVAVAAVAAFWTDIQNFFYLQAWSPAKPRAAAKAFCQAIVSRDGTAAKQLMSDPEMVQLDDEGRLKAIKPMRLERARWFDVTRLQISPEAADSAPVRYVEGEHGPVALVAVPMGGGPELEMLIALQPRGGQWKVVELRLPGPAVGGRSGGSGSGWQRAVEGRANVKPQPQEESREEEKASGQGEKSEPGKTDQGGGG